MTDLIARYSKAIPTVIGLIGQVIALGILTGSGLHYAQVALAALTVLGTVLAPANAPAPVKPPPGP